MVVSKGVTLEIKPGVEVKFKAGEFTPWSFHEVISLDLGSCSAIICMADK